MFVRVALAAAAMAAGSASAPAGENEAVRFAIFQGYTAAIEKACPAYYVNMSAVLGSHLSAEDREKAMATAPAWRKEMQRNVKTLGCDTAARDALAFTDLSFREVWEYKQ